MVIILTSIAIGLILLLIADKKHKSKEEHVNVDTINSWGNMMTLGEEDLLTELLEENNDDFDFKGKILNGQYRVEAFLGQGGMGRVYLCRNLKLGNLWAVKFLANLGDGSVYQRLAEEEILKKLNHIHLPQIVDIFRDNQGTYIVESYIAGVSLDEKIKEEGIIEEDKVLMWFRQLADVLIYLHSMEPYPIIYGDMKPSNVIITPDGRAVLVDFSVSTEYRGDLETDFMSSPIGATARFAAPEQLKGNRDVKSDIYSLGLMFFYILTGDFPEKEINFHKYKHKISKEMAEVLKKCLKHDPNLRYKNAGVLRQDLEKIDNVNKGLLGAFKSKIPYELPQDYKKIIVIMSPESTGKTTIATSLAWQFAEKRIKTILIDTDFDKKDAYYYFDKNFANCLGADNDESSFSPRKINQYLSVFTEHRDVVIYIEDKRIKDLILQSKAECQVVIVDLGQGLKENTMREILSLADHRILVVDQRVSLLNRLPMQLHMVWDSLKNTDLVVNRYITSGYLKEKNIRGYFKGIDVGGEEFFDIKINNIFNIREDYPAIIKGLEERKPPVVYSSKIKADIDNLIQNYYRVS